MNAFTTPLTDAATQAANGIISSAGIDAVIDRVDHTIDVTDHLIGGFNVIDRPAIFELRSWLENSAEAVRYALEDCDMYSAIPTARVTLDADTVAYEVVAGEVSEAFANLTGGYGYSIEKIEVDIEGGTAGCEIDLEDRVVYFEDLKSAFDNLDDTGISVTVKLGAIIA